MEYGKALIDKAGKMCGSFYKLHKETGFAQSTISDIRAGKRELPLEWVPVLAELAGEEPRDALARVMAERLPEGSRARAILGGVRVAGAVAMSLFCVVWLTLLPSQGYAKTAAGVNPLYIVECRRGQNGWWSATAFRFLHALRFLQKPAVFSGILRHSGSLQAFAKVVVRVLFFCLSSTRPAGVVRSCYARELDGLTG